MSSPPSPAGSRLSRLFDDAVMVAGLVVAAAAAWQVAVDGWTAPPAYLLAVPLIVLVSRFPLLLDRARSSIEIGFDAFVLVFLVSTTEPATALLLWSLGVGLAQLTGNARPVAKRFNVGVTILSGLVAVAIIATLRGEELTTLRELLAVAVGCTAYFVFDLVLTAVSVGLEEGTTPWPDILKVDALVGAAIFVVFDSLGYLAALVVRELPWWSALLLTVPVAGMLVAVRAVTRGRENGRRMRVLFDTSARLQTMESERQVEAALREGARDLLRVLDVEVRTAPPPSSSEVGARFHDGYSDRWITTPARSRPQASMAADQRSLEALAAVVTDLFTRLRLGEQMAHQASHDPLTGLGNRSLFVDRLEHGLAASRRRGTRLAVLFCDLDGFKSVNDHFGHAAGDDLLVEVARRIRGCLRESDSVARLGGDEFALLLEDVQGEDRVAAVSDRLRASLQDPVAVSGARVSVGLSIGVAYSDSADSAQMLLRNADLAMYEAKAAGRDRVVVYQPQLGLAMLRQRELVDALRTALEARALGVAYQPVVGLERGDVRALEALARWEEGGRPVPPEVFVRAAEDSGLVVDLGHLMLDLLLRDAPALRQAAGHRLCLAMNVSGQQLRAPSFVSAVESAVATLGHAELILEITERQVTLDDPVLLESLERLAAGGVRFAVSDLGLGFSAAGYLRRLPIHVLKTAPSFVERIDRDERACALLRSIAVMGHALGLEVVVEGVERGEQVRHLREHVRATAAQGFALHQPLSLAQAVEVLAHRGSGPQPTDGSMEDAG